VAFIKNWDMGHKSAEMLIFCLTLTLGA